MGPHYSNHLGKCGYLLKREVRVVATRVYRPITELWVVGGRTQEQNEDKSSQFVPSNDNETYGYRVRTPFLEVDLSNYLVSNLKRLESTNKTVSNGFMKRIVIKACIQQITST